MKVHSLHELAALRTALLERRRAAEAHQQAEREQALQQRRERSLFAATVGAVLPLRKAAHALPERPRPAPRARQRERDDAAVLVEAISDGFDAESLLDTDDAMSFRRRGVGIEVVRRAIERNAGAVILAHNHPSGVAEPSRADEFLTQALKSALSLVDVKVLDHLVVGQGAVVSFAERGLL